MATSCAVPACTPQGLRTRTLEGGLVDVVCIIGDRVYHKPGSACQGGLEARGELLMLTEAQAHEVGMEPCGFCMAPHSSEDPIPKTR